MRTWISEMFLWEHGGKSASDPELNSPWAEEEGDGGVRKSAEMLSPHLLQHLASNSRTVGIFFFFYSGKAVIHSNNLHGYISNFQIQCFIIMIWFNVIKWSKIYVTVNKLQSLWIREKYKFRLQIIVFKKNRSGETISWNCYKILKNYCFNKTTDLYISHIAKI